MLIIYLIFSVVLISVLIGLNYLFTEISNDKEKISPYECGFIPVIGQNRYRFEIIYYIIGLLFLGFDLEVGLLVPVLSIISEISYIGYWLVFLFFVILTVGFVYEFNIKALNI